MSCCRHPVAKLLEIAGYPAFAKQVDQATRLADGLYGDEVQKDEVQDIVSEAVDLSPKTVAEVVDQIFEILKSGSAFATDWAYARDTILKSFAWRVSDDPFGVIEREVPKLGKRWQDIRRIVSETP